MDNRLWDIDLQADAVAADNQTVEDVEAVDPDEDCQVDLRVVLLNLAEWDTVGILRRPVPEVEYSSRGRGPEEEEAAFRTLQMELAETGDESRLHRGFDSTGLILSGEQPIPLEALSEAPEAPALEVAHLEA